MKNLNYRIFPVILLAFFRVANAVALGLVIPLYFFERGYNTDLIGVLSSSMTFTYIFSPLLFNKIAKKIKKKNALLISTILILSFQIVFQFTLDPLIFLGMRLLEGIFLGLFWPVLGGTISSLNSYKIVRKNANLEKKIMKGYTLSWNMGGIFGFLIGAFVLFIISDLELIFDISLIYMIIIVIMAILYKEPLNHEIPTNEYLKKKEKKSNNLNNLKTLTIIFSFFILILYAFIGSSFKFLYPLKSEILSFKEYTNYLLSFILSLSQLIFTSIGMGLSIRNLKKTLLIALVIELFIFIFAGLNENLLIFSILFGLMGLSLAFLYCYAFKNAISKNVQENTSKYSFYFESIIGIGFFLGPLISGIIAIIGINITFFIVSILILIAIFITSIYKIKI